MGEKGPEDAPPPVTRIIKRAFEIAGREWIEGQGEKELTVVTGPGKGLDFDGKPAILRREVRTGNKYARDRSGMDEPDSHQHKC